MKEIIFLIIWGFLSCSEISKVSNISDPCVDTTKKFFNEYSEYKGKGYANCEWLPGGILPRRYVCDTNTLLIISAFMYYPIEQIYIHEIVNHKKTLVFETIDFEIKYYTDSIISFNYNDRELFLILGPDSLHNIDVFRLNNDLEYKEVFLNEFQSASIIRKDIRNECK